jgi:hypothetical protein
LKKLKRYNLTPAQYAEMIYIQRNRCAICGKPAEGKSLHIDHNHTTGKVRGLLCHNCNVLIGHAKEDREILLSAIGYLNRDYEP